MNAPIGQHTLAEINSQPDVWDASLKVIKAQKDALCDFFRAGRFENVIFTGCGSTYYLSLAAAALLYEFGVEARGLPASEIWLYPRSAYHSDKRTLLVAVSRSGETTETLLACEAF